MNANGSRAKCAFRAERQLRLLARAFLKNRCARSSASRLDNARRVAMFRSPLFGCGRRLRQVLMEYLLAPNHRRDTDKISPLPTQQQSFRLLLGVAIAPRRMDGRRSIDFGTRRCAGRLTGRGASEWKRAAYRSGCGNGRDKIPCRGVHGDRLRSQDKLLIHTTSLPMTVARCVPSNLDRTIAGSVVAAEWTRPPAERDRPACPT